MILVTAIATGIAFLTAAAMGALTHTRLGAFLGFLVALVAGWGISYLAAYIAFHRDAIGDDAVMTLFATAACAAMAGALSGLDAGVAVARPGRAALKSCADMPADAVDTHYAERPGVSRPNELTG